MGQSSVGADAWPYEVNPPLGAGSELYVAVPPELDGGAGKPATWFLHGSVNSPQVPTTLLANWWRRDGAREVKMAPDIPATSFDFASQVRFATSRLNTVGGLLGANGLSGSPVSFRDAFAAGTMVVTTQP